jgi:putative ABC transport system permease protein
VLLLAVRYLAYHPLRTFIVVFCIGITFFLPLAVSYLVAETEEAMARRAREIPLVIGPRGDRFELLLRSVYFRGATHQSLPMREVERLRGESRGDLAPVLITHTAQGVPIVATTLEYFSLADRRLSRGTLPLRLGDAVLGANVPGRLEGWDGAHLNSDVNPHRPTELSLKMRITGVLEPTDSPDDDVVFVELKTGWVLAGIGHGHQAPTEPVDPDTVLPPKEGEVVFSAKLFQEQEITEENIGSFHFHGDTGDFPVSAILLWPRDRRSADMVRATYQPDLPRGRTTQAIVPEEVADELLGLLLKIKRFFDANVAMVAVSTALFLALIVLLTMRIRRREMETLRKIGASRSRVFWIQATEVAIMLLGGLALAVVLSAGAYWTIVQSRLLV